MPSAAKTKFEGLLSHVEQLVAIHARLQQGKGRRHEQEAIHRAGVVMVVAAWESYGESLIREALALLNGNLGAGTPAWARNLFVLRKAEIEELVSKYNTPNADNFERLLKQSLGFNPRPHWSWHVGPRQWDSGEMKERLNTWISVRHAVAHGFELPSNVGWLKGESGHPRLTLDLLKECRRLFERVADQTDIALRDHLQTVHEIATGW